MSGKLLRSGTPEHRCRTPDHAERGDVWRCECGRRYTCLATTLQQGTLVSMKPYWLRRYWPWPR